MIGTEFLKGQGLGNQLLCYVTARCLALDRGVPFGTAGQEHFANNIHSQSGMYFMDVDLGERITDTAGFKKYYEKEQRIYIRSSAHDMTKGCMIGGADPGLRELGDDTLVYGNLQAEEYFMHHIEKIKTWLRVKPEYESFRFTDDLLCILNMRGGEYVTHRELYLERGYWMRAMEYMKRKIPGVRFVIITEDVRQANKLLPGIEAYHFDMGRDYAAVRNARHLILSNSSFAVLPALTSDTVKTVLAPKYWARHNVSDGYWASEQNIYSPFQYMDRDGNVYTARECREEYEEYKRKKRLDRLMTQKRRSRMEKEFLIRCRWDGLKKRLGLKN